jgi:hypothetical protein
MTLCLVYQNTLLLANIAGPLPTLISSNESLRFETGRDQEHERDRGDAPTAPPLK